MKTVPGLSLALLLCLVAACECAGEPPASCTSATDCAAEEICVDGRCQVVADAGGVDAAGSDAAGTCPPARSCIAGTVCCADGEECVDGFLCLPTCEQVRCGDNGMLCCDAAEICLDGIVCAADCGGDEELCGAGLDVCCPAGDVCLEDACITPGDPCGDDFDCRDSALYCEPTIARCVPSPGEPLCEVRPDFDRIELVEEWHFDGIDLAGARWQHVIHPPIVGDVSGDGIPDVLVPVYAGTAWNDPIIVGLSGDDGRVLFTVPRTTHAPEGEGIAVADFDPTDDALEFVYRIDTGGVRMMDGDGTTELAVRIGLNERGTLEVADMNADGIPDVIVGCRAYDGRDISNPAMDLFDRGACPGSGWSAPTVADLDGDKKPEMTNGKIAINADGSILWTRTGGEGNTAIADLNADGLPEVVVVRAGVIEVVAGADGAVLIGAGGSWAAGTFSIPGGGVGGAPTVADFDGDGLPEVATAGQGAYAVYDPDCLATPPRAGGDPCATTTFVRWQAPTQDLSSSVTGSSVFDFQGDGVAEVVYNDECFLHIYDGRTGDDVLMSPRPNSSRTGFEYPIVVDVDGDGNSEIVVSANSDQAVARDRCPTAYVSAFGLSSTAELDATYPEFSRGTHGVYVYGDASDRWVPTRRVWNQFSYHVTNVTASGDVPPVEMDNWSTPGLNNYRQNVQGRGIFNAPDLAVELQAAGACAERAIRLSAVVRNDGSRGVPAGVVVEFYQIVPGPEARVGSATTTRPLLPGGSERVTITVADVPLDTDLEFEVRVDPAAPSEPGAVVECDDSNNSARAMDRCPSLM